MKNISRNPVLSDVPFPISGVTIGLLLSGFFGLLVILKFNTLTAPFHWDAMKYVVPSAEEIYRHWANISKTASSGHPPLYYVLLAGAWKIFGKTLLASHLLDLFWGAVGLTSFTLLANSLYGRRVAVSAALLLVSNQIFFSQAGMVHLELALMSAEILTVYFYIRRKIGPYILATMIMLLIKETAAIVFISILLFDAISSLAKREKWGRAVGRLALLSLPALPFLIWYEVHRSVTGWISNTKAVLDTARFLPSLLENIIKYLIYDSSAENVNRAYGILFVLIAVSAAIFAKRKRFGFEGLCLLLISVHLIFFSIIRDKPLPRYFLVIVPFYVLLGAAAAARLTAALRHKNTWLAVLILVVAGLSVLNYSGRRNTDGWRLESNMEYLDMVRLHQTVCRYIEDRYKDYDIVTSFPLTRAMTNPWYGYVKNPLRVMGLMKFEERAAVLVVWSGQANFGDIRDFIASHRNRLKVVRQFSYRGKVVRIYEKRSGSAENGQAESGRGTGFDFAAGR
jgi:4-amino-4-deoxy-L-arabinose transferase-like glycosyltransferase